MPRVMHSAVRVLLVEDHAVVREGLRTLLERDPGIYVVGDVGTAAEGVHAAQDLAPDVVVMDVRLPDRSGMEACREIREKRPSTRIIFLTSFTDDTAVIETILGGANGYLLKRVNATGLTRAVHTVAAGQTILDPGVRDAVMTKVDTAHGHEVSRLLARQYKLSPQQTRVLVLVAEGKTNKEISHTHSTSVKRPSKTTCDLFFTSSILRGGRRRQPILPEPPLIRYGHEWLLPLRLRVKMPLFPVPDEPGNGALHRLQEQHWHSLLHRSCD